MRRIKNSLAAKVFLWVAWALALCGLLIYGMIMAVIPQRYTVLANDRISRQTGALADEIDGMEYDAASKRIYSFCIQNHVVASLTTGEETLTFGGETDIPENTYSLSAVLRFRGQEENSVLTVVASASTAGEITRTFLELLPMAVGAVLLLSALSAWFCSRLIAAPVLRVSGVAKRMAELDMTWRCETGRADELGTLAESLNTLAERLGEAMGELEAANARLREDIAAAHALEKQRRDFFAAASHELKTPVTILKGQLENMALGVGDYKNHDKYLPQTLAAVERMEQLIGEALAITKMESGIPEDSFAWEQLGPVLAAAAEAIRPLAAEKGMTIDMERVDGTVSARINRRLFQKAVSNVLSNAVRYSPDGERVAVALTPSALTVENTGAAIPQEDLPHLFTPFYRADKSRNRRSGGSGLGLYLVKTVLDLHGLACSVENVQNAVRFTIFL